MNRRIVLATSLAATAIAATFSLQACARTPEAASAAAALSKWQAGTNYTLLEKPQPTSADAGKIEVNEVFWYGCSHCFALDPTLQSWNAGKPAYIQFVRIPVVWGPVHRQHAKLYYTLLALGRTDLHEKVFETIHKEGRILAAQTDDEARAQHKAFLMENGVSEKAFNDAYDSMSVATNLKRAEELTQRYAVASVPLMIVNGKYTTGVSQAGGNTELISLINDLAASEKSR